jgi:parallel beta-helix repeat protein
MGGNGYNFGVEGAALSDYLQSVDTSNLVDGKPVYYFMNQSDMVVNADAYPQVGYLGFVNCANVTVQGLNPTSNYQGLLLAFTNNSKITSNNIVNNGYGIDLYSSSDNVLSGNNVTANNWAGILLYSSSNNNVFYHNNFINNTQHVYVVTPGFANSWDDGYPSGGNCWSDYDGIDLCSGPQQKETGSDGIGDTPYVIDEDNQDNYPLMKPYPWDPHDVGITSVTTSKTIVGQGYTASINVMIFNYGNFTETFNVTVYANTTSIASQNVTLTSGNSTTLTFTWNTSGFARAYVTSINATPVEGETDLSDNTLVYGIIKVSCIGDLNGDYVTDGQDYQLVKNAIPSMPELPKWNPNADLNEDGIVDGQDFQTVKKNIGQSAP